MDDFSWIAVMVGTLAFFFLGAAWYTVLFRKPWAADMGFDVETPQAPPVTTMLGSVGVSAVVSAVIEWFVRSGDVESGVKAGLAVGIAVAAVMGQNALYDTRSTRLYLINVGYPLLGCVIVGILCGAI